MGKHEDALYELLKEGGEFETNHDMMLEGGPPERTAPKDQADSGTEEVYRFGTGVVAEHEKGQQGLLDQAFANKGKAEKADQAIMSQNLAHASSGNFETSAPLLQPKSREKVGHPTAPTLLQKVRGLIGRN